MPDREKVIKGLEYHITRGDCRECPYWNDKLCRTQIINDALELLKGHDPVEPLIAEHKIYGSNRICANCTAYLFPAGKYCPGCGREIKWDEM